MTLTSRLWIRGLVVLVYLVLFPFGGVGFLPLRYATVLRSLPRIPRTPRRRDTGRVAPSQGVRSLAPSACILQGLCDSYHETYRGTFRARDGPMHNLPVETVERLRQRVDAVGYYDESCGGD